MINQSSWKKSLDQAIKAQEKINQRISATSKEIKSEDTQGENQASGKTGITSGVTKPSFPTKPLV